MRFSLKNSTPLPVVVLTPRLRTLATTWTGPSPRSLITPPLPPLLGGEVGVRLWRKELLLPPKVRRLMPPLRAHPLPPH